MTQFIKIVWQEMIRHLWVFFIFLSLAITSIVMGILVPIYDNLNKSQTALGYLFIAMISSFLTVLFLFGFIIDAIRHSRKKDQKIKLD